MFYGWKIVGVAFVTHFVSAGFIIYSYGVFLKALAEEFEGSRLEVSLGLLLVQVLTAVFSPFLGRILDRYSIRNIMCLGVVAMATGLVAASRVSSLMQFYIVVGSLIGLGSAMTGQLPSMTVVSNWFVRRRGTALGIATMGISLSGAVLAPAMAMMVSLMGWRQTFVAYGFASLLVTLPLVWLVIVKRPEDMGLSPDGDMPRGSSGDDQPGRSATREVETAGHTEWTTLGMLCHPSFWAILVATSLCFSAMSAMVTHLVPHVTDLGFSPGRAAFLLSAAAAAGVVGKMLFGWIADTLDARLAFWLAILCQMCGMATIQIVDTYLGLAATAAVFGLGMGGIVPLSASLVGQIFGRYSFGRALGLMSPFMLPIQCLGAPFAGFIYDCTGNYFLAFKVYIGLLALAAGALLLLGLSAPRSDTLGSAACDAARRSPAG
jgi:MFS family permease